MENRIRKWGSEYCVGGDSMIEQMSEERKQQLLAILKEKYPDHFEEPEKPE